MHSAKRPFPRPLLYITGLLLVVSFISAAFGLSLLAFGLDSPHPIYWLIGYAYGGASPWGVALACIAPLVIGICWVIMLSISKRYAHSIRYEVLGVFVGAFAVLGMLGGAGLFVANLAWVQWIPLSSDTLNGHVFHLALWANGDTLSSRYYLFRCDSADLFCDQIATVAPCNCLRPSLTDEDDPRLEVDQAAQSVSVTIKGTEAYIYLSK